MGIKYLKSYLKDHPELRHEITFQWNPDNTTNLQDQNRNILVWDAPGWLRRFYRAHSRSTKLLFDFKELYRECKNLINTFNRFGFVVVAFIDGYFCTDKINEKRSRKVSSLAAIRKYINTLKQMHGTDDQKERDNLLKKMDWIPSSGYMDYLERALMDCNCTVYRGTGDNDIDKDIARFVIEHKDSVYGIISVDSDYFGFSDLPNEIKIISEFHIKTKIATSNDDEKSESGKMKMQTLSFASYHAEELWKSLSLQSVDQRLQLICLVGNDFIKKRTVSGILDICGIDPNQSERKEVDEVDETHGNQDHQKLSILKVAADAILNGTLKTAVTVPEVVEEFYIIDMTKKLKMESNVNTQWIDLKENHVSGGGFFVHDIDGMGYCIHQKLAPLRHALLRKDLKLDVLNEYVPEVVMQIVDVDGMDDVDVDGMDGDAHCLNENEIISGNVKVWKYRLIDLEAIEQTMDHRDLSVKLLTEWKGTGIANPYFVFNNALQILSVRKWIDRVQAVALELQFQIRSSSGLKRVYPKWPFYEEYREFVKNGIPTVKDLTAQSLYWETARLICLNARNLMPPIHKLFDGPLFHFFCYLQRGGDVKGFINEMMGKLKAMAKDSKSNSKMNGKANGKKKDDPPICKFYNGTEGSCTRGSQCRFKHSVGV